LLVQVGNQHQRAAQLGTLISNFLVEATPAESISEAAQCREIGVHDLELGAEHIGLRTRVRQFWRSSSVSD